jgi:hypothetical protein
MPVVFELVQCMHSLNLGRCLIMGPLMPWCKSSVTLLFPMRPLRPVEGMYFMTHKPDKEHLMVIEEERDRIILQRHILVIIATELGNLQKMQ